MSTLEQTTPRTEQAEARAEKVIFQPEHIVVALTDGRVVLVPLTHYPRLFYATPQERENFRIVAQGRGISWPDLDEDLSVQGIALGLPSRESVESLQQWLASRNPEKKPQHSAGLESSGTVSKKEHERELSDLYTIIYKLPKSEHEQKVRDKLSELYRSVESDRDGAVS